MKQRLCIFLICWLPCLGMAAHVMSMQMVLSQLQPLAAHAHASVSEMPCHQHATDAAETVSETSTPQPHHCDVCGFCAISSGVAHFHALPHLPLINAGSATPLFVAAPVHSLSYPPAIKPPISG
jgi:hypothetical protein